MGDVKLCLLLGAMLGKLVFVGLMIGMVAALVPAIVLFARHGGAARKMAIPFGPFLAFGAMSRSSSAIRSSTPTSAAAASSQALGLIPPLRDRRPRADNSLIWSSTSFSRFAGPARSDGEESPPSVEPEYPPGAGISSNPIAQLVADLLETTGLLPLDRLTERALARRHRARWPRRSWTSASPRARNELLVSGRPHRGAAARAPTKRARELAERHHLPYVDLASGRAEARRRVDSRPRARARRGVPYQIAGDRLRIAIADPDQRPGDRRAAPRDALHARDRGRAGRGDRPRAEAAASAPPRPGSAPRSSRRSSTSATRTRRTATTSRPTTASPTPRSSAWSTRSSSRLPRTGRATSTSTRRTTPSSSAHASTACCTSSSGSPSGSRPA